MIELSGFIESNSLAPLLNFYVRLGRNGRLRLTYWRLAGDIDVRDGKVVEAVCGAARGIDALDLLLLLPGRAEFTFVVMQPPTGACSLDMGSDDLRQRVDSLEAMQRRITAALSSLTARPHQVVGPAQRFSDTFTITRGEIALLLAVNGERTVLDLIGAQEVLPRLLALTDLVEHGLVEVIEVPEPAEMADVAEAPTPLVRATPEEQRGSAEPRRGRRWFPLRQIAWAAVIVFVMLAGAAQLPDVVRQFRGATPPPALPAAPLAAEPANIWPSQPGGRFWTTPDGYHLAPSVSNSELLVSPPLSTRTRDVVVRARFRKLSGADEASYGLAFRDATDAPRVGTNMDGEYVLVSLTDRHQLLARRRHGRVWTDLTADSQTSPPVEPDGQDALSVRAIGSGLEVEVNGSHVGVFEDPTPSSGGVALYASGSGAEILVDEFNLSFP